MSRNPYADLPPDRFWKHGVAAATSAAPPGLYRRKWPILQTERIATAGSCFAQHIGRALKRGGFTLMDVEPAPVPLPIPRHEAYGYGIYSARYGNVYTARQLLQLAREALEGVKPSDIAWEKAGRFYDCFRPGVEPTGLSSPSEVEDHRGYHIERVRELFLSMDVFVFTLGLTECWMNSATGEVYPTVPGSIAGKFDPDVHVFKNFTFNDVYADLKQFREVVSAARGGRPYRMLLTVSPVPLTATAAGKHVLQATVYSKSVLRAVAGQFEAENPDIDYYPSYEIITHPWSPRDFFEESKRTVSPKGVALAMKTFMDEHNPGAAPAAKAAPAPAAAEQPISRPAKPREELADVDDDGQLVCEEYLLEQFAGKSN